jgi:hypothetical protein
VDRAGDEVAADAADQAARALVPVDPAAAKTVAAADAAIAVVAAKAAGASRVAREARPKSADLALFLLLQSLFRRDNAVVVVVVPFEFGCGALSPRVTVFTHLDLAIAVGILRREPTWQPGR